MMRLFMLLAALAFAAGCTRPEHPAPAPAPASQEKPADEIVKGTVVEKVDAGAYSFLAVKIGSGSIWAAVPRTDRKVGDAVQISNPMPMKNFASKELGRTFDVVYFGNLFDGNVKPVRG